MGFEVAIFNGKNDAYEELYNRIAAARQAVMRITLSIGYDKIKVQIVYQDLVMINGLMVSQTRRLTGTLEYMAMDPQILEARKGQEIYVKALTLSTEGTHQKLAALGGTRDLA